GVEIATGIGLDQVQLLGTDDIVGILGNVPCKRESKCTAAQSIRCRCQGRRPVQRRGARRPTEKGGGCGGLAGISKPAGDTASTRTENELTSFHNAASDASIRTGVRI